MMKTDRRKHISIKWSIFQYLIGFCLLLLILLWLLQTVFLESFYKTIKLNEAKREANAIAELIAANDWAGVQRTATRNGELYVELWSGSTGSNIFSKNMSVGAPSEYPDRVKQQYWEETAQNGGTLTKRFYNENNFDKRRRESILHMLLLETERGTELLLVNAFISPVNATVDTLRVQLYWISTIMLLLAVGLALLMSRRVSKPIERLNAGAKELMHGQAHFETEGYQEIVELSETLELAAQELMKTDRHRKELIANVSHDLRTPLTLITGYAEMMKDLPDENTAENMQVIIDESRRLTSLVNNLLNLSRLQSDAVEIRLTRFNLTQETKKIIERFERLTQQSGYSIRFSEERDVFVRGDVERLAQVIYNFIGNAITHTGDDKQILVRQVTEESRVRIEVSDTGGGIPQDRLEDIWERYYKMDQVHKRDEEGTGLGLSIVKSILDQHPGVEYGVESEVGKGSTFWFSLPREDSGSIG